MARPTSRILPNTKMGVFPTPEHPHLKREVTPLSRALLVCGCLCHVGTAPRLYHCFGISLNQTVDPPPEEEKEIQKRVYEREAEIETSVEAENQWLEGGFGGKKEERERRFYQKRGTLRRLYPTNGKLSQGPENVQLISEKHKERFAEKRTRVTRAPIQGNCDHGYRLELFVFSVIFTQFFLCVVKMVRYMSESQGKTNHFTVS